MWLTEINWNPSRKELRNFGRVAIIASIVISVLLYLVKGLAIKWCAIIVAMGLLCFVCSLVWPVVTRCIYVGLMSLTFPIGMVVSFVLLAAFYYLLLTPVGLIFRLFGRDPLHRRFDRAAKSYWIARSPVGSIKRYFNQF